MNPWPLLCMKLFHQEKRTNKQEMAIHFLFLECCETVWKILENYTNTAMDILAGPVSGKERLGSSARVRLEIFTRWIREETALNEEDNKMLR